jgi:hypothetical protein
VILAIDPGPKQSALVLYDRSVGLCEHYLSPNDWVLAYLDVYSAKPGDVLVIEQIANMGMAVGNEVFETVRYAGRFEQQWARRGLRVERIKRIDVKLAICGQARAKDANIRAALVDRFGGSLATKKGGPLHGVAKDVWAALACACAWSDRNPLVER